MVAVEGLVTPSGLFVLSKLPVDRVPSDNVVSISDVLLVSIEGVELASALRVEPLESSSGIVVDNVTEGDELDSVIAFDVVSLSGCSVRLLSAFESGETMERGASVASEVVRSV